MEAERGCPAVLQHVPHLALRGVLDLHMQGGQLVPDCVGGGKILGRARLQPLLQQGLDHRRVNALARCPAGLELGQKLRRLAPDDPGPVCRRASEPARSLAM